MVQPVLEGTKTQTRRIIKPFGKYLIKEEMWHDESRGDNIEPLMIDKSGPFKDARCSIIDNAHHCPYGYKGDILWVKENFIVQQINKIFSNCWMNHVCIDFPASEGQPTDVFRKWFWLKESETPKVLRRKHPDKVFTSPSIFLPRKCSRIQLEITNIRVERLHDITTDDIIAEGVKYPVQKTPNKAYAHPVLKLGEDNSALSFMPDKWEQLGNKKIEEALLFAHWAELWCEINGRESWDVNPWVWVIEFKIIESISNGRRNN